MKGWVRGPGFGVRGSRIAVALLVVLLCAVGTAAAAEPFDSQRLAKAKDLIADEQWLRAIGELQAAVADPKEPNKDEALFWLAHSQNQAHDSGGAVDTIRRLEREHPRSRWVKPARSLRIEIAGRLGRDDVLWYSAGQHFIYKDGQTILAPIAVTPRPDRPAPAQAVPPAQPAPPAPPATTVPPPPTPVPDPRSPRAAMPAPPQPPLVTWFAETYRPDADARIYALQNLIKTDAPNVIPILKEIALDGENPAQARRAIFVLAQSNRPEARSTVVEVARTASEPVRIAAVRELGRLGGPTITMELLQVYSSGNPRVKYQVVNSLGERAATEALFRIAESEKERELRDFSIRTLGEAGGRRHLLTLYSRAAHDARRAIVLGLFNARGDEELIAIARKERDAELRREVLGRLRMLGTPQARQYLLQVKQ